MPPDGGAAVSLLFLITLTDKICPFVLSMVPSLVMVLLFINVTLSILSVCPWLTVNDDPAGKVKSSVMSIIPVLESG